MMKDRYDGNPGKESAMMNERKRRLEEKHMERNAFVKKKQAEIEKYAGRHPEMEGRLMDFNAQMQNNGAYAQKFGAKLTEGMDRVAFPYNEDEVM